MTSRRKFILQCSVLATAATVPAGPGMCSPFGLRDVSLDRLGFSTFARLVGSRFYVYQSLSPVKLELVQASADRGYLPRQRTTRRFEPEEFCLIFRGGRDQLLGQDTYPFTHEQIGRFVMFIGPVWAPDEVTGVRHYQVIFNRPAGFTTQQL